MKRLTTKLILIEINCFLLFLKIIIFIKKFYNLFYLRYRTCGLIELRIECLIHLLRL